MKNIQLDSFKQKSVIYFLLAIVSVVFLLIHSGSTSPLFMGSDFDSNVFMLMGKYFNLGKTPYVDYFDHKGPVIIFIEAFTQLLNSDIRTGAFILQCLNLFCCLLILYKTCRIVLPIAQSILVLIISLCYLVTVFHGGNRVEEFSLLPILVVFYFTLLFVYKSHEKLKLSHSLIIGICCAFVFWIRPNNLACMCACIIFVVYMLVKKKEYKEIAKNTLAFLLGFLLISVPILVYFQHIGALNEMLYASFGFNFSYLGKHNSVAVEEAGDSSLGMTIRHFIVHFLPSLILSLGCIFYVRKTKNYNSIVLSVLLIVISILATRIGLSASYYMIITIPVIALGLIYIFISVGSINPKKDLLPLFCISLLILLSLSYFKFKKFQAHSQAYLVYYEQTNQIIENIPQEERGEIYTYEVNPKFLYITQLTAYYRYFISQKRHGGVDKRIFESINQMMVSNPPKWVVLEAGRSDLEIYNPELSKIIIENYAIYKENDNFILYKHKK